MENLLLETNVHLKSNFRNEGLMEHWTSDMPDLIDYILGQ